MVEDSTDDADLVLHHLKKQGYSPVCERVESAGDSISPWIQGTGILSFDYIVPGFSGLEVLIF